MITATWKRWYCTRCKTEFKEHELVSTVLDVGDRYQPPEHDSACPQCGALSEHHEEVEMCESCEDEYPMEDSTLCGGCTVDRAESIMEDR